MIDGTNDWYWPLAEELGLVHTMNELVFPAQNFPGDIIAVLDAIAADGSPPRRGTIQTIQRLAFAQSFTIASAADRCSTVSPVS
jgi:hypothetical protein